MAKYLLLAFVLFGCARSIAQPSNDNFVNALVLVGRGAEASVDNTGGTSEPSEPDHAGIIAIASVWWRWVAPADGGVTIRTEQSQFATVLAVYTGRDLTNLTRVASNDRVLAGNDALFNVSAGTEYWIAVDGYFAESGVVHLSL